MNKISSNAGFQPLYGRKILITRTEEENEKEKKRLESLGAVVVEIPVIEICPPSSWVSIDSAISRVGEFDWVIFTSANGVKMFFQRFERFQSRKQLKAKFACVGPVTRLELERHGFHSSFVPDEFLTARLGEEFSTRFDLSGKKILLARSENSPKGLFDALSNSGANVIEAPVYKTMSKKARIGHQDLDGLTDVTLTSPSTVEGLVASINSEEIKLRNIKVHCIGPVTAKRARELGLVVDSTANVHTFEGLTESIAVRKVKN